MEEESKVDRTLLSSNKDKFSFTMSHKKMLRWVSWDGPGDRPRVPPASPAFLCFCSSSKILKPQMNAGVFGSLQNVKDNKSKPVRDEYEYVSDEGELKIDEFPIRRKKNSARRDQTCEYPEPFPTSPHESGRPERFLLSLIIPMLIWLETRS